MKWGEIKDKYVCNKALSWEEYSMKNRPIERLVMYVKDTCSLLHNRVSLYLRGTKLRKIKMRTEGSIEDNNYSILERAFENLMDIKEFCDLIEFRRLQLKFRCIIGNASKVMRENFEIIYDLLDMKINESMEFKKEKIRQT